MDEELTLLLINEMLEKITKLRMSYITLSNRVTDALAETDLLIANLENRRDEMEEKICQKKSITQ